MAVQKARGAIGDVSWYGSGGGAVGSVVQLAWPSVPMGLLGVCSVGMAGAAKSKRSSGLVKDLAL